MDKQLDLLELLREFPEAYLTVHAGDLGHFARELLAEARQEFERERAAIAEGKKEEYLTPEMVKTLLRISESTLYRMAKAKILVPVFVGGQKRYRRSDLDKRLYFYRQAISKTLIPDDERRQDVNRGILITVTLLLAFLFIYWLFDDLAVITDASRHPFLLVLLELAKVFAGIIIYLSVCWGFKVCVHVVTLKSEKPAPVVSQEVQVEIPPEIDLSQSDPLAVRDFFTQGTKQYVISNLYDWIVLEGNRTGPQLAYLYIALTKNHLIESKSPSKLLEALENTYPDLKFASWSTLRHAYSDIKNRPDGRMKKEDQEKADAIFKILTVPKPPK